MGKCEAFKNQIQILKLKKMNVHYAGNRYL